MKITPTVGTHVRYVLVWVSDPFPELLPRLVFSPLLSTPFPACCGSTPCLGSKEGERETYLKTDLFYAFVMKANLFSNVQCLNGIGQQREVRSPPFPSCSLPPTAQSAEGWSPDPSRERLPRAGRAQKSWSKDLVTLSTLDDPLGFSGMNPVGESVCVHSSTPRRHFPVMCSRPPSITCCRGQAVSWPPVPNTNVSLSLDGPKVWCKGQRKWFGIPGRSVQACLSSLDFPHSFHVASALGHVDGICFTL